MAGAKALADAEEVYFLENGEYTNNFDKLDVSIESPACKEDVFEKNTTGCTEGAYFEIYNKSYIISAFVQGNKAPLYYMIYFQHSSESPGKQVCVVNSFYYTDAKFHQICKSFGGNLKSGSVRYYYLN